jgi:hypothetical protein
MIDLCAMLRSELKGIKHPFGLKEYRFRWQDNKNRGEFVELKGKSVIKTKEPERLEHIHNVKHCFSDTSKLKKYVENKNSIRTLIPEMNNSFDSKRRKSKYRLASACGSIANLIECTKDVEIPNKKVVHYQSKIFEPEEQKIKYRRRSVDFDSMAGKKIQFGEEGYYNLDNVKPIRYIIIIQRFAK